MTTTKINDYKNYMSDSEGESDSESIHTCYDEQPIPSVDTMVDEYMTTIEDENKKLKEEIMLLKRERLQNKQFRIKIKNHNKDIKTLKKDHKKEIEALTKDHKLTKDGKKDSKTLIKEMDDMYTRFLETFSKYKKENKELKKKLQSQEDVIILQKLNLQSREDLINLQKSRIEELKLNLKRSLHN